MIIFGVHYKHRKFYVKNTTNIKITWKKIPVQTIIMALQRKSKLVIL